MQDFKEHAIEALSSVWLVLVALGYVAGCLRMAGLVRWNLDLSWAYFAMLLVAVAGVSLSIVKRFEDKGKGK